MVTATIVGRMYFYDYFIDEIFFLFFFFLPGYVKEGLCTDVTFDLHGAIVALRFVIRATTSTVL